MDPKWNFLAALWEHRKALMVLVLIVSLIAPQPVRAQFGIDWAAIVAAIDSIGTAISNTIGPALTRDQWSAGDAEPIDEQPAGLLHKHRVSPGCNKPRARSGRRGSEALYAQSQAISGVNVASATLANPQQLEQLLLSRNPMNVPGVTANYQTRLPDRAGSAERIAADPRPDRHERCRGSSRDEKGHRDRRHCRHRDASRKPHQYRTWRRPRLAPPRWSRPKPLHGSCEQMRTLSRLLAM